MKFDELLEKYITFRKGGEALTKEERAELWEYVNNYIVGLSKRLFKQHNYKNRETEREVTRHDLRVAAFYDFVDYAIGKDRGVRWILAVFKFRFPDLEGLLMLKHSGAVYVDDIIKSGISNSVTRRATALAAARRNCAKRLKRNQNISFDDLLPCLVKTGASEKVIANWKRYHQRFEQLREMSQPLPLKEEFAIEIEDTYYE